MPPQMTSINISGQPPVISQAHGLGGGMTGMVGGMGVSNVPAGAVSGVVPQPISGPVTTSGFGVGNTTLATKLWQ